MTCLHSNSIAIVKALLDHGANPNLEEGVPAPVKANSLYVQKEGKDEGEILASRDEEPGAHNKVMFLVGDGDGGKQERVLNNIEEGMSSNKFPCVCTIIIIIHYA